MLMRIKKMEDPGYITQKKEGKIRSSLDKQFEVKVDKFLNRAKDEENLKQKLRSG